MNKKILYLLLYGIPGLIIALLAAVLMAGSLGGGFWIFLFGDNPWPKWTEYLLIGCAIAVFIVIWAAALVLGYKKGKEQKVNEKINPKHIFISAGVVAILILGIFLHQYSVGSIGPKPDSVRCSDFCNFKGYTINSIPPSEDGDNIRDFCVCLDENGKETEKTLLKDITP